MGRPQYVPLRLRAIARHGGSLGSDIEARVTAAELMTQRLDAQRERVHAPFISGPAGIVRRPCAGNCGALVETGRCPACRQKLETRRGTTKERGYAQGWPRIRAAKLAADPFCQIRTHCAGIIATEVDHKIPISERPDLRLTWSNLQSACKPCNVAKAHQEGTYHQQEKSQ